ncbi:MAG: AI-2E family transporter, partial [Flavobacteriaceae bacterium]
MKPSSIAQGILQAILYLFLIAVGIYALYLLQSLITYILIAAVISLIGRPITVFLNTKLKFGNTLAVVSTMIFFLIILFGLLSLFVPLILQQGENLSKFVWELFQHTAKNPESLLVSDEIYEERLNICKSCEWYDP